RRNNRNIFRMLILLFLFISSSLSDPIVQTEYGPVEGFNHEDSEIFLGVPFAAPPIGDLRFANPVPPQSWTEPRQAKNWSDACVPHAKEAVTWKASEDCLYLNVIAPKRTSPSSALAPVLFYIHGGGFEIGNAKIYGYEELSEIYNKEGIIVVSIQYRIGVLGFFTLTASDTMKGNYGMMDQVAALKFVHKNIHNFGGDPSRITVFGISAGGSSASMLTLSPLTRNLIAGSIEVSGTAHAGWAIDNRVEHHSEDLVDAVGCWGKRSVEDIEKCVRKVSVNSLYAGVEYIFEAAFSFNMLKFAPRIDGVFAPRRYEDLAQEAPKIPTLTGINALESAFFILMNRSPTIHRSVIFKGEMPGFNADKFDMKVRILLNEFLEEEETDHAVRDVLDFYLGENAMERYAKPTKDEIKYMLRQYTEFWSDVYFNLPARYRADERKSVGAESYVYLWEHYNKGLFKEDDPVPASVHINEMPYIVGLQALGKFEWDEEESKLRERARQMMTSFIKNGKPSVDGVLWPSYSQSPNAPFVRIASPEWKSEEGFWSKNNQFWEEVMSKYSYDFVRFKKRPAVQMQIPAPPTRNEHEEL
ncbi:hypothetical protein PFISCL1PPCAC_2605, partial [Pristionchus fissidentatus]